MLAVRRGSASAVTKSLTYLSSPSICLRSLRASKHEKRPIQYIFPILPRAFGTSWQWRRQAAAAAALEEEEAIEDDIAQQANAPRPHPESQINARVDIGPVTKFKELAEHGIVCQTVVDTLTRDMGLETMTQVQSLTINETLKGIDVLAQARTGTGKTLAFLIPLLQNIINYDPSLEKRSGLGRSGSSTDIRAIIISPTRELAEQIAVEAKKVTRNTGVIVQTAVGGSAKSMGLQRIKKEGCHVLVGTPGRLNDILSDPYSQVRAPNLSAFVLDEADRLLDQGFAPDIAAIQDLLPSRRDVDRQTLLYSATVPREIMRIVRETMKPNFKFVRTVQEGEQATHERVPQKLVNVGGFENLTPALTELCLRELQKHDQSRPFKAIVYFGATADVSLASGIMQQLRNQNTIPHSARIIEMHARLSQEQRTRAAESFRRAECGILLSSDVTARGMDFPNVSHVIQIGLPPTEEQYVHRIGRTARGDKSGEGWLFITDLESREVRNRLRAMPLVKDNSLETAKVDMKQDAQIPEHTAQLLTAVVEASRSIPRGMKAKSYLACLGIYAWYPDKQALVDAMNDRARFGWGMENPPAVSGGLASRLNLTRVRGLNIGSEEPAERNGVFSERSGGGARNGFSRGGSINRGGYGPGGSDRGGGRSTGYGGRSSHGEISGRGRGGYQRSQRRNSYPGERGSSGGRSYDHSY
ncbi:MAG: hypothetical protein Q9217_003988 [Psora testacea]